MFLLMFFWADWVQAAAEMHRCGHRQPVGGHADTYIDFLLNEVKPFADPVGVGRKGGWAQDAHPLLSANSFSFMQTIANFGVGASLGNPECATENVTLYYIYLYFRNPFLHIYQYFFG